MQSTGEIVMYQTADGKMSLDVKLENETVWLSQAQIVELFGSSKANISEHIMAIYQSRELGKRATVRNFRTVQKEGNRLVNRNLECYNLDMIISIGYRVNSKRGIQFRVWANKILKDYLIKGYTVNEQRLREQSRQLDELKQSVKLLGNVVGNHELTSGEATGLLKVITDYAYALDVLDQYDHQVLEIHNTTSSELYIITYEEAMLAIKGLRDKFGGSSLFGNEKMSHFRDH